VRALVTGGAGFIGSHVVDALAGRGDEVLVIDDMSSGREENLDRARAHGVRLLEANITDRGVVAAAFADHRPELVCHLAAQIDVRRSVADPGFDLGINVGGTINLLDAAREHGTSRFVFTSTGGAIYGEGADRELPFDETAECRPDAPYGQSKFAAEGYVALYGRLCGLSGISLRLGNIYGPRQDPHGEAGVVAIFCTALREGRRPSVFGDGMQTRDYVYVGDVVEAFVAAAGSDATGAYNIGTGVETSVLDLGERLARSFDREFDPEMAPPRPGEVQRISISSALARERLGWSAATELDRGVELTADSFR
jgi:UDP-glucose 4-epimerase